MKTLAQIEKIVDLDSRVINAAALLEAELRPSAANSGYEIKLGDLVQQQKCFAQNGFIRDVNFALGVRNAIAHFSDGIEPSSNEKTRAAEYLIRAIALVRQATGNNADGAASESQVADSFDKADTRAALNAIYRSRIAMASLGAGAVFIGSVALCGIAGNAVPPHIILGVGVFLASLIFFGNVGNRSLSQSQYYSLPGSQFDDGDHRCIYCGRRAKSGHGIYTHGQYKSSTRFHDCSKCKKVLFTS